MLFIQLLKKKSFDKITINEVSKTADINRVTFYNYFIDKYDWFQKYLYKQLEAFILLEKKLDFNSSDEEIYRLFYNAYAQLDEHFDNIYLLLIDRTTPFHQDLETISKQSFQEKLKSINNLEWWIKENRPWSVEQIAKKSTDCLRNWII